MKYTEKQKAAIKENLEPISDCELAYRTAFSDWLDREVGEIITEEIDGQYYDFQAAKDLIAKLEDEE